MPVDSADVRELVAARYALNVECSYLEDRVIQLRLTSSVAVGDGQVQTIREALQVARDAVAKARAEVT